MTPLHELIGKNVAATEVVEALAQYPELRAETEHLAPDDDLTAVHYLRSEDDGLLLKISDEGEILTIFFMAEGKEGFSQFQGPLPGGLRFDSSRREVVMALGVPGLVRPAGKVGSFEHGESLRFDTPAYSVHFQFRRAGGIELVTVMAPHLVPGRTVARKP